MTRIRKIDRRDFLKATGLSGTALVLGVQLPWARAVTDGLVWAESFEPSVFISLHDDGTVQLTVHRSEMGQGVRTACAMLLAEELDVAWADVTIVQATGDPKYGNQTTDGSRSVRTQWEPLRRAGAAAREMLVAAAAADWGVPASECRTEASVVIHTASDRRAAYATLVGAAAARPVPENPKLKRPSEFRIIGRPQTLLDAGDIVQGKYVFGWDVEVPGMLHASLERSPKVKGRLVGYDAAAAKAVAGVLDVVELEAHATGFTNAGVAVLADNTWAAMQGRKALNARWEAGPLPVETSSEYRTELEALAGQPGQVVRAEGDFDGARARAERVIEATYHGPYLVHAPMEPPVCTAVVGADRCEVWAPTQAPQWARGEIADMLGIAPDNVTVNVTMLGGGFGRKSKPDFILEAVALARKVGKPIKLAWTREDEVRHGFYRAQSCQRIEATVEGERVTGWRHRTVFPAIGWGFAPGGSRPSATELSQGFTDMPYRIPNVQLEAGQIASCLRIGWWRSVCHTFHAFAVNSHIDELAHATGQDPVAFRLAMLGAPRILEFSERDRNNPYKFNTGRLSAVIEKAAEMADWGRELPERHGLGFAAHYSFLTYVAMAMHVSVDRDNQLKVHQVDCAVDCGQVVNPDTVTAQMEGAVVFGLTAALYGAITVKEGAVEQGNFHDYPMMRMAEAPQTHVHIMASDEPPTGIGEPGVPPVAPALTNAIFAATGVRLRGLPLSGQKLG